jgi:hypothetical protein
MRTLIENIINILLPLFISRSPKSTHTYFYLIHMICTKVSNLKGDIAYLIPKYAIYRVFLLKS